MFSPELLLQIVQHFVAGQYLRNARIGFAALADGGDEFAVLQLDAVHRHIDIGNVDLFFFAGEQIIVAREIGRAVADITEERAERPVIVES